MPRATSNLLDVAAQFGSSIIGRGAYLLLQVLLARVLGPREFGFYAIGWTVSGLIGTLAPAGMPQAVIRYGIAGPRALVGLPIVLAASVGSICMVGIMAAADPIARDIFGEPLASASIRSLAPSVPLLAVFGVLISALRSSAANLVSALVGTLLMLLYLAVTELAIWTGEGHGASIAGNAYTAALLISILPAIWMLRRLPAADGSPAFRRLLHFGVVTMFINGANLLNLWADRLIIGVMTDARSIGIYQIASQLAVAAIVVRSAVVSVFESRVPKIPTGDALVPDITYEFSQASRLLLHVSAPGLICLALTASFWTDTLFGHAYRAAAWPLVILAIGQLAMAFTGPSSNALHMSGGEHTVMRLTIATSVLNVLGNIALIPWFSLAGSAVAFGVANAALGVGCMFVLWRTGRFSPRVAMIADIGIATAACCAAMALVAHWLGASLSAVVGNLVVGYLIYGCVIISFCRVDDEAVGFIRRCMRRLASHGLASSKISIRRG